MIIGRPHKPLLLTNAGASAFLATVFMNALQSASERNIQRQVDNRYRIFYGAVFNLMAEYFMSGFALEKLRDSFELSFGHTDKLFQFSIRPLIRKDRDIAELHQIIDDFQQNIQKIAEDLYLEEASSTIHNVHDLYEGARRYILEFEDVRELLKLSRVLYSRINCIDYDESDRYTSTVVESMEERSPFLPKLTRIPSIEYIEEMLRRAQGRDATNEAGDFYYPNYTN